MAEDREIRQQIWDGAIPIVLTLDINEVTTLQAPEPYYLLAPRCGYFPIVITQHVRDHFLVATLRADEMWLDYNGIPLKWHYPIGVLFDLYGSASAVGVSWDLPWPLTIHFQGFPEGRLLRCPNDDTVKAHYMNVLKQANYLRYGDNTKINDLSLAEQNDLWQGIRQNKFDVFWKINSKITVPEELPLCKYIPFRVCRPSIPAIHIQEPIPPKSPSGTDHTLGSALKLVLPELFPEEDLTNNSAILNNKLKVIIQGITPPLETPLTWLNANCSHFDNFLYAIILTG